MPVKQFVFSVSIGGVLVLLGALLATQASIGFTLMGVGFAIAVLAAFTRYSSREDKKSSLVPAYLEQQKNGSNFNKAA